MRHSHNTIQGDHCSLRNGYCPLDCFVALKACIHLWTIKTLYHVRICLCFFHTSPFSLGGSSFLFPVYLPLSRRLVCTDGLLMLLLISYLLRIFRNPRALLLITLLC